MLLFLPPKPQQIRSQWEKTLSGDQKTFLREVQQETDEGRRRAVAKGKAASTSEGAGVGVGVGMTARDRQRAERKELLRKKQEARAARSRGETNA